MKIYFVGIGGCSMSALARILRAKGYGVRGSDRVESDTVRALRKDGIGVTVGHGESVVGSDLVVYTCGVPADNVQLVQARALGIPVLERAEVLGEFAVERGDCVVIGNEGHGLSEATIAACDACVLIPMSDAVESFNAAVAASILMWEFSRKGRAD